MGILDNDTVIVDAILTKIGRQKLAQGQPLGVTKFAFGDTGVDYTLYNPNHPSGSDSYGTAITSLPMLEAVPDDNVFMRSKLWGDGDRNISSFSFINITSGTSVVIEKIPGTTTSYSHAIIAQIFPVVEGAVFDFKVLDMRGMSVVSLGGGTAIFDGDWTIGNLPPFNHPTAVPLNVTGATTIELKPQDTEISSNKSFGVEITRDQSAPAFVTITANKNDVI